MKIVLLKGISGTGKTTTTVEIIKELKRRGYSVGTVKDIHAEEFYMDTEGTNTYLHRQAGAQLVTARGKYETDIMFDHCLEIDEILDFYDYDYVILEGDSGANAPIILTAYTTQEVDERMNERVFAISGRLSESLSHYRNLPVINALADIEKLVDLIEDKVPHRMPNVPPECCHACGSDCRELLAKILKGEANPKDCIIKNESTKLSINGEDIPMVPFVKAMLRNIIIGTVKELKGYKENSEIIIKIK